MKQEKTNTTTNKSKLQIATEKWKQLERKTAKQRQIADEFYADNLILELKKQKRGLDKSIAKLEKSLETIFDNAGVDCMEIAMGLLVRRKTDSGYEWLVEL